VAVGLHRVVVLPRRAVDRVDADRGCGEQALDVAVLGVGRQVGVDPLGPVAARMVGAQRDVVLLALHVHAQQAARLAGHLDALRDDDRDDLPAVGDARRLQDRQFAGGLERRCVVGAEDREPAGQRERRARVDPRTVPRATGACTTTACAAPSTGCSWV